MGGAVLVLLVSVGALAPRPAAVAHAQGSWRMAGRDLRTAYGDAIAVWRGPATIGARDWLAAGGVLAATAALSPLDDDVDRWLVRHERSRLLLPGRPFREDESPLLSRLATAHFTLPLSGVAYVAGVASKSPQLRDGALGCAAAQHGNSIARHVLYKVVARKRPRAAGGDQYQFGVPGREWEWQSFIGGHAANAMSCASFLGARFRLGAGEPMLYVAAGAIGLSRLVDRRHWMTDVILGEAFGYAVGRTVARRSLARRSAPPPSGGEPLPALAPSIGFGFAF